MNKLAGLVRTFAATAVLLSALVPAVQAQDVSEEQIKAARATIAALGVTNSFDNILPNLAERLKNTLIQASPNHQELITATVDEKALSLAARRADLENEAATIYAKTFSLEELNAITEFYGSAADKLHGDVIPYLTTHFIGVERVPHGVTGHIVPWNYPMQIFGRSVGAALAAGNATVVKPAEDASLTILRVAALAREVGFPDGALNVVTGLGRVAGAALAGAWAFLVALFKLRELNPTLERPFSVPWFPLVPIIFCNMCVYMLYRSTIYIEWRTLFVVVLLLIGVPLYLLSQALGEPRRTE